MAETITLLYDIIITALCLHGVLVLVVDIYGRFRGWLWLRKRLKRGPDKKDDRTNP